jgi:hypothetical protein
MLASPPRQVTLVYRDETRTTLCSLCDSPGEATCLRCGRPLCREHAPAEETRCGPCETWFDENSSTYTARTGRFSLARMALPSRGVAVALLLTPASVVGAAFLWEHARRRRERDRFLAERPGSQVTAWRARGC